MKVKYFFVLLLAVALGIGVYSMLGRPRPRTPLRIIVSIWPPWDLMRVAKERGYFKQEGVQLELLTLSSNEDILRAVEDRSADGAFLGLDMCVRVVSRGVPCKMVLITDVSKGSEGVIARSKIATPKDLKGCKIGVTVCACSFISLMQVLNRAELKESDVQIVNLPEDSIVSSFEAGKVDAIAVWEPNLIRYAGREDAHKLIDSTEYPDLIMDGLAFSHDAIRERPEEIAAVIRVWHRILGELAAGDEALMNRIAEIEGVSREQITTVFTRMELCNREFNRTALARDGKAFKAAERNAELLLQFNQIPRKPDVSTVFDTSFSRD
jgi:NitT/TauT family transport system substrate-binding protein